MIKNNKFFGVFNIVDVICFLLLVLLVFFGFYRYNLSKKSRLFNSDLEIEYTAKVSKVNSQIVDNIYEGELIFLVTARENAYLDIGKVKDIKLIPYKELNTENIEFYDLVLTIYDNASLLNDDYLTDSNVELHVGNKLDVVTKYTYLEMEILSIKEIN